MIIIETMGNMLIGKRKILNKEMDVYTTGAVSLNTVKIWSMIGGSSTVFDQNSWNLKTGEDKRETSCFY